MRVKFPNAMTRLLPALLMVALLPACGGTPEAPKETVPPGPTRPWAVLYSFAPEGQELKKSVSIVTEQTWAGRPVDAGWLVQPVVLVATGVGMANAVAATQYVIDTYEPQGILFTGISGGVNPAHQPGDIVIPDQWITHDFGYWGPEGFEIDSVPVGRPDTLGFAAMLDIPADTLLVRRLGDAANRISYRFRTVGGRLPEVRVGGAGVSGNTFIDSKVKREWLSRQLNAEIVDLESAAVVQTARAAGVPVVVVRTCSGLVGSPPSESGARQTEQFMSIAGPNMALILKEFLESPEQAGQTP